MGQALTALLNIIAVTQVDENLFLGNNQDIGLSHIFGGQIISQALYAAKQMTPADRFTHSLHTYFLRPGNCLKPIYYEVKILRDGLSFSSRQVIARQDDQDIFYMMASFQEPESGLEFQSNMPQVAGPELLLNETQLTKLIIKSLPAHFSQMAKQEKAIEIRPIDPINPMKATKKSPLNYLWFRANGKVADDLNLHHYLLSYMSDIYFLPTALQPHGFGFLQPCIKTASIDHAIWFHRAVSLNDWLLYAIETPSTSHARGLVRGQIFTQQGVLVASTCQEGLIRLLNP